MAALAASCGIAHATVFSGTSGARAASVEFTVAGTDLHVRLTNTATADVMVPVDVLTGVFFDIAGPSVSLGRTSAVLAPGSIVTNGPAPLGGVVGGEWAYNFDPAGFNASAFRYGISSSGLGSFGPSHLFPGPDLAPPTSPDGLQYGLASAGDNPSTHNGGANTPLIQNSVDFVLSGLPVGFDLARISAVRFQYGTDYAEPHFDVPAPGALALLGLGALVARRRR